MRSLLKYQSPALCWALFILIICSIHLGKAGESHLFFPGFDKLTHTGLFFVLVVFTFSGLIRKQGNYNFPAVVFVNILALMVLFGGAVEVLQWKVFTYRSGDWNDLFCDVLGSLMAMFSILTIIYAIRSKTK